MERNRRAAKNAALVATVLFGTAVSARAQDVRVSGAVEPPAFSLPSAATVAATAEEQGRTAYMTGDFSGAILAYTQVLQLRPDDAQAHFIRGLAELALNRNHVAEQDFSTYIGLQALFRSQYPANREATSGYFQRGRARMVLNRFADAISDFTQCLKGVPPRVISVYITPSPPDLFAFAFMERAVAHYRLFINSPSAFASDAQKSRVYAVILADYDAALAQPALRPAQAPVALFNRALVVETQAADTVATPSAAAATARYAAAIKGYEAYLEASPKSEDAAQVKQHIAQIGAWLVANTNAPRPVPPAALVLKPTP